MTVGIIGIIGIAGRVGVFADMRLRHFGFFTASTVVEGVFLGNYVWLCGLIWFPVRDDERGPWRFLRRGGGRCVPSNNAIMSH